MTLTLTATFTAILTATLTAALTTTPTTTLDLRSPPPSPPPPPPPSPQASARQRRGRAGRLRPGKCFKLYPRDFHDSVMANYSVPEMQRTPLEELCLSIKALGLGDMEVRGGQGAGR